MRYLVVLLLLIPFEVLSQPASRQMPKDQSRSDAVSRAIRQDALSTADQVIDQVSEVQDLRSRVALAEKLVRILAKSRPERLRKLLNSLFDEAVAFKTDSAKISSAPSDLDAILGRIIQSAALIDVELARSYVETLSNLKAVDRAARSDTSASTLYLRIASELIRSNPSLAVEVATRSLADGISPDTLLFLASLRKVDTPSANRFFVAALRSCQMRGAKDVNELLLLYSYVFSPLRVATVVPQRGIGLLNIPGYLDVAMNYPVDAALAQQYLYVVGNTLLNPVRYNAGNIETLALGVEGDFFVLKIIEPWVAAYLPTKSSAIAERRNVVVSYMQSSQREAAFSAADLWKNSTKDSGAKESTEEYLINKAEAATDPKRKDQLYFRAALVAVQLKKYETAFDIVQKISASYNDKAKQFLRFEIALQKIKDRQFSDAEKLARMDSLLARKAYIFILIADNLIPEDPSRALQYLDEVQQLVEKLSDEKEKLSVLIGAASVYARFDTVRASEILQQIIQHANKVQNFMGDSTISNVLEIGGFYYDYSIFSDELNLFDLVKRLAAGSYYATLHDIRSLSNVSLRLHAILALCSAVILEENQPGRAIQRN